MIFQRDAGVITSALRRQHVSEEGVRMFAVNQECVASMLSVWLTTITRSVLAIQAMLEMLKWNVELVSFNHFYERQSCKYLKKKFTSFVSFKFDHEIYHDIFITVEDPECRSDAQCPMRHICVYDRCISKLQCFINVIVLTSINFIYIYLLVLVSP